MTVSTRSSDLFQRIQFLRNSDRITVIPPPPHMNFNEARRDTSASGISLTSRGSLLNNDLEAKSSGSQQQSPMTIIRRRSFPPQLQQPGHDLAPDERADYYREQVIAMRGKETQAAKGVRRRRTGASRQQSFRRPCKLCRCLLYAYGYSCLSI